MGSQRAFCHACRAVTTIQKQYLKNNEALNVLCNIVLEMNLAPLFFWHESCFYSPAMLTAFPMETYLFNVLIPKLTCNFVILLRKDGKRFQFNAFIRLPLKIQLCFETSIDASFFINSIWIMSICLFSQKLFMYVFGSTIWTHILCLCFKNAGTHATRWENTSWKELKRKQYTPFH